MSLHFVNISILHPVIIHHEYVNIVQHCRTVTLSKITLINIISSLTFLFDWQWRSIDLCALSDVI